MRAARRGGVERYLASKPRPPQSMFDHLYARLPAAYVAQRQILRTTIAATLYLISENRKLDEVTAKLAPGEIEHVIDIVQCWPD